MNNQFIIKINFTGGLISPGELLLILRAALKAGISYVSFGLRQQLFIEVQGEGLATLTSELTKLGIAYEVNTDHFPNIISSYPAEEVFITKTWLSEGAYKDIFDSFDYKPTLKINISDSRQSFTPMLTGNINWIASNHQHFWYPVIRFPKTNVVYYWKQLFYTNDIAAVSKQIEIAIIQNRKDFYDNANANGDHLTAKVMQDKHFITRPVEEPLQLAQFQLPYYEGLNKFFDKYWLGIYRRDEMFSVRFLMEVCDLCLHTKLGQLCSTPWKSIIIKGIAEKDKHLWNKVMARNQINVRHAANELNFQVEDTCRDGLSLKQYIVKHFTRDDARTFGICFGIKTRKKSEVFCNILVRKKSLFTIAGIGFFSLYDILFAEDFNPNERTGKIFSRNNINWFLPEQLRLAILAFTNHHAVEHIKPADAGTAKKEETKIATTGALHQCKACLTVYDEATGDDMAGIAPGTRFEKLPADYTCSTCDSGKEHFRRISAASLMVTASPYS